MMPIGAFFVIFDVYCSSSHLLSSSRFWAAALTPALAALPGAKITLFFCRYSVASRVVGMFAPSHTARQPLATRAFASSKSSSF